MAVSIKDGCWIKIIIAEHPYKLYKIFSYSLKTYLKYFQMRYMYCSTRSLETFGENSMKACI